MVAHLEHAGHDHALHAVPGTFDALDLDALARDQLGELVGLQVGGSELPQP